MRTEGTALGDRSTAVAPPIVCNHPDDVADVTVIGDYRIFVRFHDGTSGVVDLSRLILSPHAGVFAELQDTTVFAGVSVVFGAVTWPGEIDIAPDGMYNALRRDGEWVIE
jgi:hypothetical protein